MATSKWQDFKQRHLGGTTQRSSFSPLEQRPTSQQLYNSYAKAAEEDESEWEKFKRKHNVGAQVPQGIVEHQRAQEKSYKAKAQQSNAEMAARAQMLPELQSKIDNGMTLNPTEELQYARASIEALSEGERSAMSQIKKGQDQNFSDHARYDMNGSLGFGQQLINKYVTKTDTGSGTGNKTIKEAQEILRSEYGWDEDKIKNYTLMSERLSNAQGTEEYNKAFAISQDDSKGEKIGKATANTAWNLFNAPTEGVMGALSNLRAKPEGFGRDTNSWVNLRQNSSDAATEQVVQNAITDSRPAGQFLYQAGLSTAESAARAMTGSSFGNGKLRSAITTGMSAAGVYNSSYQNARERGASDTQAQLFGIASGAAEAAGEFLSLEHLWKMADGTKVGKDLAAQWLAQAGIEASEEAVTDLVTRVADYMVLGKDGKSEMDLARSYYMGQGMSEEEATQNAEKDFWKQVGMDALGGAISGGIFGAGGFVAGNMNAAQNKQRAEAVQGHFKDTEVDANSEYGAALKQDADRYANNPTQYMADMIDDSTEEGKKRKAEVQKLAQKEAQGQRLSASDRNYIEESLYVAENAAQQSEDAMSARDRYNQYANEMAAVPAEYRTAATNMTEDEMRADLAKGAANGDIEFMGETLSKARNSKSADLRNKADEIYDEYASMAEGHGITREQLEAFKISPQEAYSAGLKGEGRGNVGALSMKAAEAYRAGQQAYQNNRSVTVVENKSDLKKASASTKDGKNVVLAGVFSSEGNVMTQDGQQVSVSDLNLGDGAVQKAYGYADTQPSVMAKNAYLGNIKDGMNIDSYDIAFKSVFRAGRSGMEYDSMIQNGKYKLYAEVLGEDTVRAMYDAGAAQTQMEKAQEATASVNAAFQIKKGNGVFEDARVDKSDKMNTEVFRMMANVSGLNIRLVDDQGSLGKEGANAYFDPKTSTIVVGSHASAQAFHEVLGEFTKFYNSTDYAVMKKAAMAASAEVLGEDTFNKIMDNYAAAYGRAGESNTDAEMSDEMTNDYAVAVLSTEKGRQAFAKYLAENCTQKQANSIKDKIVNLYKGIVRSIKNVMSRSNLMSYQRKLIEEGCERLEQDADLFVKAFAKAVENYRSMEDGATATAGKAFSINVDDKGNTLSEQQQEFFADSKIRDKEGRLKVMHHGSNAHGFTVFDIKKAKSSGMYGKGFYFSDSDSHAGQYGKAYSVYLNIKNPLMQGTNILTKAQIKAFVDAVAEDEDYGIENYGYGSTPASVTADVWGKDDFAMLQDINATCIGDFAAAVKLFNEVNGTTYDGIVVPTETVAFHPSQIKNINNENPTGDPDIRYSIEVDTEGSELTEGQKKFFKRSRAADENGNLVLVHHGTVREFYSFDREYANAEGDMGKGFYFTNNTGDVERNYANFEGPDFTAKLEREAEMLEWEEEYEDMDHDEIMEALREKYATAEEPITMDCYLNIENPVYVGRSETYLLSEFDQEYDIDDFEDENDYYDAVDQIAYDAVEEIINHISENLEGVSLDDVSNVLFECISEGGATLTTLKEKLNETYIEDENGNLVANEVARLIVEALGYDGIIDSTVSKKFKNMGMSADTVHYIVFNSNQAKLVTNENPTSSDDVRYSLNVKESDYSYETMRKHGDIPLYDYSDFGIKGLVYSKELKAGDISRVTRDNIKKYNEKMGNNLGSNKLYNRNLGANVLIDSESLKHGSRHITQGVADAKTALPLYFENAIVFNEADGMRKGADKSYILFGAYRDGESVRIARATVNHYNDGYHIEDVDDVLYASVTKKEEVAAHMAAPSGNKTPRGTTPSKLTITQLMYAVKENYPNEMSEDVANHLEYKRGKSDIEGLRFSLEVDDFFDIFGGDNVDFTSSASILEEGMEALKHKKVDEAKVRSVAYKLRKEFASTVKVETFVDNLQKVFAYMQTEDHVNYNDMMRVLNEVAAPVIDQATTLEGKELYDAFIDAMKGYSIKLTDVQKQEVASLFGAYGEFRRMMMPLNISDKGTSNLEMVWSEIAEASGGVLDADTVEGDMPAALYDALTSLRPSPVNNYGGDKDAVSKDLAMRIVEEYLATQSDAKAKAAAEKMKKQHAKYRANLRESYEKKLKEAKKEIREKYAKSGAKMRDRNEEKIAQIRAKNKQAATNARRKRMADHEKKMISKRAGELMKWVSNPTEKHHVPRGMVEPVVEFLYALDFVEPDVKQNKDGKWYVRVFNHSVIGADGSRSHVFDTLEANTRAEALQMFYDAIGSGTGSKAQRTWAERMRMIENIFNQVASGKPFDNREMDDFMETIDPALAEEFTDMLSRNGGIARINQLEYEDLHLINKALMGITHSINQGNKAFTNNATIEEMARSTIEKADNKKVSDKELEIGKSIKKLLNLDMLTPQTYFHTHGKGGDMVYDSLRKGFNTEILDVKKAQEFMQELLKDAKDMKKWTGDHAEIRSIPTSAGTIRLTDAQIMALYVTSKRKQAMEHMKGGFRPDDIRSRAKRFIAEKVKQKDFHLTEADIKNITDQLTDTQKAIADKMQQFLAVDCATWGNEASMRMYGYEKFVDPHYFPIKTVSHTNITKNENIATETMNGIERSGFTKQIKEGARNPILIRDIFDVFTEHVEGMAAYHGKAAAIKDANRWFNYRIIESDDWQQTWKTTKEAIETNSGEGGAKYYTKLMSDINGQTRSQYIGDSKLMSNYKAASVGFNLRVVLQQPTAYIRAMNVIDLKYLVSVNPKNMAKAGKRVKENSPIAWWKAQGHRENSVSKSMRSTIIGNETVADKLKDASMWAAGVADDITWGVLYEAVIKEQRDVTKGMGLTEEQFQQRVNDRFDEVVDKTQVVDSMLHRSQIMRSKDRLNVIQTAFMSEPTKTYNMMYESLRGDKKQAARALATYMITAAATSAAASIADMIRYTEDGEEPEEVWWENFTKNFMENIAPWNLIPTIKDVAPYLLSFITGESTYTSSNRMDMDAIYNMVNSMRELQKAASGESNKNFYGVAYSVAQGFSQITGVPVSNITRELVSVYNLFMPDIKKTKTNNPYNLIYDEIKKKNGDVEAKVKFAMSNDGNISDIESGITSRYKSDYYEAYQKDPKKAQEIADEAKIGLVAIGMTEAEADATIEGWQTKKKTYTEIDKAIESGEGIAEEIKALKEEKKAEDIAEHIINEYSPTIEYNRKNNIESSVEGNVNTALKAIDSGYSYDERKKYLDQKAAESEAKSALTAERDGYKQTMFRSIDAGSMDWQKAVQDLAKSGVGYSDIKGSLTTQYKEDLVKAYNSGKDVTKTANRIASVKAYCDSLSDLKIPKKYGGDYYSYELDQIKEWLKSE